MIILDTDHCVEILRRRLDISPRLEPAETLAVTSITVGELIHGARISKRLADNLGLVDALLSGFVILVFDEQAARTFGELKANLEGAGMPIADLDLQIASIALRNNATLVTHNTRHFRRVPNLALDDWLTAEV